MQLEETPPINIRAELSSVCQFQYSNSQFLKTLINNIKYYITIKWQLILLGNPADRHSGRSLVLLTGNSHPVRRRFARHPQS